LQQSEKSLQKQTEQLERLSAELVAKNWQLEAMTLQDALTDLANRRCFDETLDTEWARAARTGQPLALLLLDVDHFKEYNDRYGHQAGDECLRSVAQVLRAGARRVSDLAARYGGEEFVVIAADTDTARMRVDLPALVGGRLATVHHSPWGSRRRLFPLSPWGRTPDYFASCPAVPLTRGALQLFPYVPSGSPAGHRNLPSRVQSDREHGSRRRAV